MIRVMLADDNEALRRAIRDLLELSGGFGVVGDAATGLEALAMAIRLTPDVLILDCQMPDLHGLEVARRLAVVAAGIRILILSGSELDQPGNHLPNNIKGYCVKMDLFDRLPQAVMEIYRGHLYFPTLATLVRWPYE
jgi:DNA-binding NarL/FixJ family response regulator